jgi:hypothetical protein
MADITRLRDSSLTVRVLLMTWETVETESPARSATSRIVTMSAPPFPHKTTVTSL